MHIDTIETICSNIWWVGMVVVCATGWIMFKRKNNGFYS